MPRLAQLFGALVAVLALGCDRAPTPDDLREWTPADHDRAEENARVQQGQTPTASAKGSSSPENDLAELVELTWRQNCAQCHGASGHGDGPNGALVHAPDLTSEALQAKVSDEEMTNAIKNGKNLMPKFDFSDRVVGGLVARIRASRGH
ncbi:MAG: c-type cytochrome [Polyangiaceae bacterium]